MVTPEELDQIMKLRGQGRTQVQIAEEIGKSPQTVSNELKKLREQSVPKTNLTIIPAQDFQPQATTVSFEPKMFENLRIADTIYATTKTPPRTNAAITELYEMRGDVIHHTILPRHISAEDYSLIHDIIGAIDNNTLQDDINPGGYKKTLNYQEVLSRHSEQIISTMDLKKALTDWGFDLKLLPTPPPNARGVVIAGNPTEVQKPGPLSFLMEIAGGLAIKRWDKVSNPILKDIPSEFTDRVRYWHETGKGSNEIDQELKQARSSQLASYFHSADFITDIYKEIKVEGPKKVKFCLSKGINNFFLFSTLWESGAESKAEYDLMFQNGFKKWVDYQDAVNYGRILGNFNRPHTRHRPNDTHCTPDELNNIRAQGWDPTSLQSAHNIGIRVEEKKLYDKMFEMTLLTGDVNTQKSSVAWARSAGDLSKYEGFSSPRAAVLYGIIEMSPTSQMMLDSLLSLYLSQSAPGPVFSNVNQLHTLLDMPPFTDICVSNLKGGIVEKKEKLVVIEKEVVKEVVVEKEVIVEKMVEKKTTPLFNYGRYSELNSGNSKMNQKIRAALDRCSLEDSLTASFTRFESHVNKLWKKTQSEPVPKERGGVKLIDMAATEMKFPKPMLDKLHQARMLRNDELHPDDPSGLKLTDTHIKKVLEATEKIIVALG